MKTGKSDIEILLAAIPAGSVTVQFTMAHSVYIKDTKSKFLYELLVKCIKLSYDGGYQDFERGIFKFHFNDTKDYLEVIISENTRELHFFCRYNKVLVSAKSKEDMEMLSTMALMVL